MPMNVKAAERRTGYRIIPLYGPGDGDLVQTGWVARQYSGIEVARAYGKVSRDGTIREIALLAALELLCRDVYNIHGKIALERAGGRCEKCRCCRNNLTRHHIKKRSHGRWDAVENLLIVCMGPGTCCCHEKLEGQKIA